MPIYKISINERVHRNASDVEIEADDLKSAMDQLAEEVMSPDFDWGEIKREMMVLELSVDDKLALANYCSDLAWWPKSFVKDGRVWEGDSLNGGDYIIDVNMPREIRDRIEREEDEAV